MSSAPPTMIGIQMPDNVPLQHQERAYTSPIWFSPN